MILQVFSGFLLCAFWAAVLSFVPITFYLLIRNPSLYRAGLTMARGIYILTEEDLLRRGEKARTLTVGLIYGVCALLVGVVYALNAGKGRGVWPVDILSTGSVVLFCFSVVTYFPMALFVSFKGYMRKGETGLCLSWIFMGYEIALAIFSLFFALTWLKDKEIIFNFTDAFGVVAILFAGGTALACLPILFYILFVKADSLFHLRSIHPNVVFVLYSLCFLIFSGVFIFSCVKSGPLGLGLSIW